MTRRVALLIAANLASDAPDRRADAGLFELEERVLREGFAAAGAELTTVRWSDEGRSWGAFDAALALTCWDYQDRHDAFLRRLGEIEAAGCVLFNSLATLRWNIRKTYLRDLARRGAPIVPTLWSDAPQGEDVTAAFDAFGCDAVVVKRQVGAGARGQARFGRSDAPRTGSVLDRPGMIQPLLPSVVAEGEFSFIFIDGAFCHALLKQPAPGDYRIQASYGGQTRAITPKRDDLDQATRVLAALSETPLYARIDMVRGADGALVVMEVEAIEPYLFPTEGSEVGVRLAKAVLARLG